MKCGNEINSGGLGQTRMSEWQAAFHGHLVAARFFVMAERKGKSDREIYSGQFWVLGSQVSALGAKLNWALGANFGLWKPILCFGSQFWEAIWALVAGTREGPRGLSKLNMWPPALD